MSRNHTVLVVDDEPNVRTLYADALREWGHWVEVATDGAQALDRLRSGTAPCVVLSDLRMPRMDGFELARAVRHDPSISAVPVVVMTGDTILSLTSPARGKSFEPAELDALVERSCRLHRASDPGSVGL